MELSASQQANAFEPNIGMLDLRTNKLNKLHFDDLKITNITTRDIDKGSYKHFLEKEIRETGDIVEKTVNAYLQPEQWFSKNTLSKAFNFSETQIPSHILEALKEGKLKKLSLLAWGLATAAVAISMFMRASLKPIIPDILIETHVASEGSALH